MTNRAFAGNSRRGPVDQRFYFDVEILSANAVLWELADESLRPRPVNEF